MARGPIPYIAQKTNGDAVSGATIAVAIRGGGPATIYANETGATPAPTPLLTDVDGKVTAWLDEGSYDVTISGATITTSTRALEVLRGSGTSAIADGAVTGPKIAANAVDNTKVLAGSLADTALASPTSGVWRTIAHANSMGVALSGGSLQHTFGAGVFINSGTFPATNSPVQIPITASALAIAGKTTNLRIGASLATNTVTPASSFTVGLNLLSSVGGGSGTMAFLPALASVGSQVTFTTPASATVVAPAYSAAFALPADGTYVFCLQPSASMAAGSAVSISAFLQLRHI